MEVDKLKLENQLCFPFYALSRLIIREYQPELEKLGITYPQYLVMMVLWEDDGLTVNDISQKLILNTNTLTPLLKRLEKQNLIKRERSKTDERKVHIFLTTAGVKLKEQAVCVPDALLEKFAHKSSNLNSEQLIGLKTSLNELIAMLSK